MNHFDDLHSPEGTEKFSVKIFQWKPRKFSRFLTQPDDRRHLLLDEHPPAYLWLPVQWKRVFEESKQLDQWSKINQDQD